MIWAKNEGKTRKVMYSKGVCTGRYHSLEPYRILGSVCCNLGPPYRAPAI